MATKCEHCPLRRREIFHQMSAADLQFMQRFKVGEKLVRRGTRIMHEGSNSPQLFTALEGMGLRYKMLADGRRQVVNLVLPGDFIGLQAAVLNEMGHSVEATTDMTLCVFHRADIWELFVEHPERAFAITWTAAVEENLLGEVISNLGQRTAQQALAWVLTRVFLRARALGLTRSGTMKFPFKQQDLADALGLSLVHTNKSISALRAQHLFDLSDGVLQIPDIERLAKVAGITDLKPKERPII